MMAVFRMNACIYDCAVGQMDHDALLIADDVAIGDDVAALIDDNAGPHHILSAPTALTNDLDRDDSIVRFANGFDDGSSSGILASALVPAPLTSTSTNASTTIGHNFFRMIVYSSEEAVLHNRSTKITTVRNMTRNVFAGTNRLDSGSIDRHADENVFFLCPFLAGDGAEAVYPY